MVPSFLSQPSVKSHLLPICKHISSNLLLEKFVGRQEFSEHVKDGFMPNCSWWYICIEDALTDQSNERDIMYERRCTAQLAPRSGEKGATQSGAHPQLSAQWACENWEAAVQIERPKLEIRKMYWCKEVLLQQQTSREPGQPSLQKQPRQQGSCTGLLAGREALQVHRIDSRSVLQCCVSEPPTKLTASKGSLRGRSRT